MAGALVLACLVLGVQAAARTEKHLAALDQLLGRLEHTVAEASATEAGRYLPQLEAEDAQYSYDNVRSLPLLPSLVTALGSSTATACAQTAIGKAALGRELQLPTRATGVNTYGHEWEEGEPTGYHCYFVLQHCTVRALENHVFTVKVGDARDLKRSEEEAGKTHAYEADVIDLTGMETYPVTLNYGTLMGYETWFISPDYGRLPGS